MYYAQWRFLSFSCPHLFSISPFVVCLVQFSKYILKRGRAYNIKYSNIITINFMQPQLQDPWNATYDIFLFRPFHYILVPKLFFPFFLSPFEFFFVRHPDVSVLRLKAYIKRQKMKKDKSS